MKKGGGIVQKVEGREGSKVGEKSLTGSSSYFCNAVLRKPDRKLVRPFGNSS